MSVAFGKPDEPPRFDDWSAYLQRIERERAEREFRANPPAWTRPPFTTRTHAINPDTGEFTPIQENPMTAKDRHDELVALLTEIRDRLPERVEARVAPFDPDVIAANLEAIKHETETPTRGHGECCEPTTARHEREDTEARQDDPDEPEKTHPCPGCGTFTDKRVCNSCWGTSDDPEAGYSQAESIEADPAPADDLPGEPVEPGDLRAGDKVEFTYVEERITGTCTFAEVAALSTKTLRSDAPNSFGYRPHIAYDGFGWCDGISDVRLIERAPREGEDRDEALARVICKASGDSWIVNGTDYLPAARAARKHISRNQPVDASPLLEREREEQRERAEKAEAERDGWRAKHAVLRADVEERQAQCREEDRGHCPPFASRVLLNILGRDDARTPQADPDAVTLRRADTEALLSQWEDRGYHETDEGVDPLYSRVRAALGWGDEA